MPWSVAKDRLHQVADNMNDHVDDVARRVRAEDKFDDKPSLPPKNEIPLINGRRPINSKYAGRVFDGDKWSPDLAKKYPGGVRFTNEGFPDFSPYSRVSVELDDLTGKYAVDARAANQQAGLTRTPEGYVWHLVEDALTLQLLPQDIHAAVRHTGGAGVVRSRLHLWPSTPKETFMPIRFDDPQPIDRAAVRTVEEQLGFDLPAEYVELLTSVSNGGSVEPAVFADDLDIGVVGFLGVARTDDWDLATRVAQYAGDLPDGLLPIADAEGGNLVCTEVGGGRVGSIWFWDHEHAANAARRVAASLDAFIAGLESYDNVDATPEVESAYINPDFLAKLKREGKA